MAERAPTHAILASRTRILTRIAQDYHELVDPMQSRAKTGDGEPLPLMPPTYTPTVREFERLMGVMREDRRSPLVHVTTRHTDKTTGLLVETDHGKHSVRALRWHIQTYHCDAVRIIRHYRKPIRKGQRLAPAKDEKILRDNTGAWVPAVAREDWARTPGARLELANAGIEWIAQHWALSSEPMLPTTLSKPGKAA